MTYEERKIVVDIALNCYATSKSFTIDDWFIAKQIVHKDVHCQKMIKALKDKK